MQVFDNFIYFVPIMANSKNHVLSLQTALFLKDKVSVLQDVLSAKRFLRQE